MHDDLLERRLRSALADEAARLPLTITSAELERRLALRGRGTANRRLTLLLAAAVAIGALGVGGVLGGAIKLGPTETGPVTALKSTAPTAPNPDATPTALPTLDELIASTAGDGGEVFVAQSHDPFETRAALVQQPYGQPSSVAFTRLNMNADYSISVVCLGDPISYDLDAGPGRLYPQSPTTVRCDGSTNVERVANGQHENLTVSFRDPTRWRVVLRSIPVQVPLPTADPIIPATTAVEELSRMDNQTIDSGEPWKTTGLLLEEVPAVPGRIEYGAQLWCPAGREMRVIFGDHLDNAAELTAETETVVRCDGTVQEVELRIVQPHGSRVYVAAAAGTPWSLVLTSRKPPVSLLNDQSGWQLSSGFGPEYAFEEHGVSLSSGGVEGGGPLLVALECAGPAQQFDVTVDQTEPLGDKGNQFIAHCAPFTTRTVREFTTRGDGYSVGYTAPARTWTALSILIPSPLPTRR